MEESASPLLPLVSESAGTPEYYLFFIVWFVAHRGAPVTSQPESGHEVQPQMSNDLLPLHEHLLTEMRSDPNRVLDHSSTPTKTCPLRNPYQEARLLEWD